MNHITKADIDKAMEIINTPIGGDRGSVILNKSDYMYLCGMVRNMAKRISEQEKVAIVWYPYPDVKPTARKQYLCCRDGFVRIFQWMDIYAQFDVNPTSNPLLMGNQPQWWAELPVPPEKSIIEGSAEWALNEMRKGWKVTKEHLNRISRIYWFIDDLDCVNEVNCGTIQIKIVPEEWIKTADTQGWHIYVAPKPAPSEE